MQRIEIIVFQIKSENKISERQKILPYELTSYCFVLAQGCFK